MFRAGFPWLIVTCLIVKTKMYKNVCALRSLVLDKRSHSDSPWFLSPLLKRLCKVRLSNNECDLINSLDHLSLVLATLQEETL